MRTRHTLSILLFLLLLALVIFPVLAKTTTASYELSWWSADGGGISNLIVGNYALSGSAGQPDAGILSNDDYDLTGGFWAGIFSKIKSFLPIINK